MTIWAAKSVFQEKERGSLEVGKNADFIILNQDLMNIDERYFENEVLEKVDGKKRNLFIIESISTIQKNKKLSGRACKFRYY